LNIIGGFTSIIICPIRISVIVTNFKIGFKEALLLAVVITLYDVKEVGTELGFVFE